VQISILTTYNFSYTHASTYSLFYFFFYIYLNIILLEFLYSFLKEENERKRLIERKKSIFYWCSQGIAQVSLLLIKLKKKTKKKGISLSLQSYAVKYTCDRVWFLIIFRKNAMNAIHFLSPTAYKKSDICIILYLRNEKYMFFK
jgi:hypothetical protein